MRASTNARANRRAANQGACRIIEFRARKQCCFIQRACTDQGT